MKVSKFSCYSGHLHFFFSKYLIALPIFLLYFLSCGHLCKSSVNLEKSPFIGYICYKLFFKLVCWFFAFLFFFTKLCLESLCSSFLKMFLNFFHYGFGVFCPAEKGHPTTRLYRGSLKFPSSNLANFLLNLRCTF